MVKQEVGDIWDQEGKIWTEALRRRSSKQLQQLGDLMRKVTGSGRLESTAQRGQLKARQT